ncbi:MAG: flavin reductase family protein [Eubacteriaceae bacterium]|nr:flavin reductase family protein [Eubacteriaceae bacterium]
MSKKNFDPGAMLNPVPVVMVSCGDADGEKNIITIAWTGIVNSIPPMTYVSVRKERYSHHMIEESGEFVINLVTEELAFSADWCGVRSGKDFDKFKEQELTPEKCREVSCPAIAESPLSLECRVTEVHEYGSHDMFVAEIVNVTADEKLIDGSGRIRLDKAGLVAYSHGEYFGLKRSPLGRFGYSVMKSSTKKKLAGKRRQAQRNSKKKQSR